MCTDAGVIPEGIVVNGPAAEKQFRCDDPGASDWKADSRYEPNTGFGVVLGLLGDAGNGFNRINQYLMLWTAFFRWQRDSRFAFNRYRHHSIVVAQDEVGSPPIIIPSRKDVVEGCGFEMFLYGNAMMPLCKGARDHLAESLQTWFLDDLGAAGNHFFDTKVKRKNQGPVVLKCMSPSKNYLQNSKPHPQRS
ncbi:hypothetical protein ACHAWF_016791 [Thalassiosira exigua]